MGLVCCRARPVLPNKQLLLPKALAKEPPFNEKTETEQLLEPRRDEEQTTLEAVWLLQALFRGYLVREQFLTTRRKVSKIQALARGWKSRKNFRRARSSRCVSREILETEEQYIQRLTAVIDVYKNPLQEKLSNPKELKITAEEVRLIFVDNLIEIIIKFHSETFLRIIRDKINKWSVYTTLSDAFKDLVGFIKLYTQYINGYEAALKTLSSAKKRSPAFKKFLESCVSKSFGLDLESLLIAPIQRIPRYELLLKELIKHTPKEHQDYTKLNKSLEDIVSIAITINKRKGDSERMNGVVDVLNLFNKPIPDLITPSRRLLHQGSVTFVIRNKSKPKQTRLTVFLFNDMILTAKQIFGSSKLKIKQRYEISSNVVVKELEDDEIGNCYLQIDLGCNISWLWSFRSTKEKIAWKTDLCFAGNPTASA